MGGIRKGIMRGFVRVIFLVGLKLSVFWVKCCVWGLIWVCVVVV